MAISILHCWEPTDGCALIGAWTKARSALCVVDAGTAVKVDSVDAGGQHLGGLIVPGIHMMREALMKQTSDIAKAAMHSTPSLAGILANNTIGAVSRGAVFALAGMADRAAEVIEQSTGIEAQIVHHRRRCRHDYGHDAFARRDRAGSGAAGIGGHRVAAALGNAVPCATAALARRVRPCPVRPRCPRGWR